jgi:hypothetical protein
VGEGDVMNDVSVFFFGMLIGLVFGFAFGNYFCLVIWRSSNEKT